jgi:hypothetical protein
MKVPQAKQHQLEQLCMQNIRFFKEGEIIPHTHPDLEFADCASITFECQKRKEKHDTVTQESSGDSVLCYKGMDSSTQVSAYIRNGIQAYNINTGH